MSVRPSLCDEVIDPQARLIAASVNNLRVFSIYAPNGQAVGSPAYEYKLHWYERLRRLYCRKKNPVIWSYAGISTSLRKTLMSMIRTSGAEPSWRRRANARRFENYADLGLQDTLRIHHKEGELYTWWDYQMRAFAKIAAYASTQFWRARQWRRSAAEQESILKCAKARNHPITRQCGRNFRIKKTPDDQLRFSELNDGRWALNVGALMTSEPRLRVSNPPPKPLMIWDGECHFCKMWIERWRETTAGKVDYATYQQAASQFPEIPLDQFKRAMAFIEPDGKTSFAAEAVYRSLQYRSSRKWLAWSYDHVPGFADISETAYKFIARHRSLGSSVTRMLWGKDVRPPTYFWARRWFLRALGVIYLIAFVSLWVQVDGLDRQRWCVARESVPAGSSRTTGPKTRYALLPTLCWFNSSNAFLHFLCGGGVVLSVLLIFGIAPALSLVALLLFTCPSPLLDKPSLSFQWDILLLETGFLSIFLAPWRLWPRELICLAGSPPPATAAPVSRAGLFLLKFLLFKLMLMSGVVKLTSGDDCWWNLTALDYHYWSQPLPTVFGWWADKSPGVVQAFLSRVLSRRGNHRPIFHLGATASTSDCRWIDDLSSNRDRHHRELLLLQSADDRVVLVVDR